jgi:isoamylase
MSKLDEARVKAVTGRPFPLGAYPTQGGVHFAIFSRHATRVWLCIFKSPDDSVPAIEFDLDPKRHRIGDVWCALAMGVAPGAIYAYRMDGPNNPALGFHFDSSKFLLDPYARAVIGDTQAGTGRGVVMQERGCWENNRPHAQSHALLIYELHVRGYTKHKTSRTKHAGTYKALAEKIPYLKELGVTAVELMPVQAPGERVLEHTKTAKNGPLRNFWGYCPIGFFAPSSEYADTQTPAGILAEFREMVEAFHDAGIEVYLDVVFNHTAEGGDAGETMSFRGIDNSIYYLTDARGGHVNHSGCGNTMRCGHPVVSDLVLDCLRYWVTEMHVDGFRFDLATILNRDQSGHLSHASPLVQRVSEDPVLRNTKLIAEAWDVGGGYQVASFGDSQWMDWNDRFRDDVRHFWLGAAPSKNNFALRLTGSPDLYQRNARLPHNSINFVTSHDGFTLRDLVSYNEKHNEENAEGNRDGMNNNYSWNCGVEGETDDPEILALRSRLQKNFLATLFLSLGVPMLLAGDEFGRTQRGNNNAYCQDNEISWVDWSHLEGNAELRRFCDEAIRFRRENTVLVRNAYFTGKPSDPAGVPDIAWFEAQAKPINWSSHDPFLACLIGSAENNGVALYMAFNPTLNPMSFKVPDGNWHVRINTARPTPNDICRPESAPVHKAATPLILGRKSMVVLTSMSR